MTDKQKLYVLGVCSALFYSADLVASVHIITQQIPEKRMMERLEQALSESAYRKIVGMINEAKQPDIYGLFPYVNGIRQQPLVKGSYALCKKIRGEQPRTATTYIIEQV